MRCKACNVLMGDVEVIQYKDDETEEDLCSKCKSSAHSEYNYTLDHVCVGDSFTEGLTYAKNYRE